jgi:hypothetical protein
VLLAGALEHRRDHALGDGQLVHGGSLCTRAP